MLSSKTYYELQWQAYFKVKLENVRNLILTELKLCYCLEVGGVGRYWWQPFHLRYCLCTSEITCTTLSSAHNLTHCDDMFASSMFVPL